MMENMLKKLLTVCLMTALCTGLLAGCGSDSAGEATTSDTDGSENSSVMQLNHSLPTGDIGKIEKMNDLEEYTEEDVDRVDKAIRAYTPSVSDGLLINNAQHFYYYEQLETLSTPEKDFYEAMYMTAEDPVSADYYISITLDQPIDQDEFKKYYQTAYQALCFDHPELFWLYNYSNTSITAGSEDGQTIYFSILDPYTTFEQDMEAFNQAADSILSQVDQTASDMDKARQIHDIMIDMVTYDTALLQMGNDSSAYSDLGHSAYGVLVKNSRGDENTAVCDGYSLAYQYLLTQCGIDAVLVPGKAGNDVNSLGGHAWNMVKLDGKWYEIDSTWDDNMTELQASLTPDMEGYEYYVEALTDSAYMERLSHFLFGISTAQIRDYQPAMEDYYITSDGQYQICLTGESHHYRADETNDMGEDSELAALLPQAEESLSY